MAAGNNGSAAMHREAGTYEVGDWTIDRKQSH